MKSLVKTAIFGLYKYSGVMSLQERLERLAGRSFLTVLLFHRVTDEVPHDGITVGTEFFRNVCSLLKRRFHTVPLAEAMKVLRENTQPKRRMVAITFDDCYRDNLDAACVLA